MFIRKIILYAALIAGFALPVFAQSNPIEKEVVEQTIAGIEAVAKNAIAAAFIPMTDYDKGDLLFIGSPGYLRVREVYQNPPITGDPLNGGTLGMGAGYAVSDRFMIYNILTGLYLKGALEADFFSDGPVSADVTGSFLSLFSGVGFEAVQSKYLSLPLFLGFNGGFFSTSVIYPGPSAGGLSVAAKTSGRGFLGGISGGLAAKIKYKGFSVTPYYLYMANFNGANLETRASIDSFLYSEIYEIDHEIDPYRGGYFGVSAGLKTKSGWFYNLSLKNLFPSLSQKDDAIDFTAVILSVGYAK